METDGVHWWLNVIDWRCIDCGVDTDAIDEYYMLLDEVWAEAHPDYEGNLCIECVEQRLGRTLTSLDFAAKPVNVSNQIRRSVTLQDRLSRNGARP
jgi:hypothetical protein